MYIGPKDPPVVMVCVIQVFWALAEGMSGKCELVATKEVKNNRVSKKAIFFLKLTILTLRNWFKIKAFS
jgi:hypothetical protein